MNTLSTACNRYNAVAAGLHWLIAILIFVQIYVGWMFGDMERGLRAISGSTGTRRSASRSSF